jgi:hypothetical protein
MCVNHARHYSGVPLKPQAEKKPIKKVSDKQKMALKEYNKLRKVYLVKHPTCEVKANGCTGASTEVHHVTGRVGKKLTDPKKFKAVCHNCHVFIENNPVAAKKLGHSASRLA